MSVSSPLQFAEDLMLPTTRTDAAVDEAKSYAESLVDDLDAAGGKVYAVKLNQTGTGSPVPTILKNTLGVTPVWARSSAGVYTCTSVGAFPINKVLMLMGATGDNITSSSILDFFGTSHVDANSLIVTSRQMDSGTLVIGDGFLVNTEFYVVVYP